MRNFFWSQPALNFGFASPSEPWMLPIDHPDVLALQEELERLLRSGWTWARAASGRTWRARS